MGYSSNVKLKSIGGMPIRNGVGMLVGFKRWHGNEAKAPKALQIAAEYKAVIGGVVGALSWKQLSDLFTKRPSKFGCNVDRRAAQKDNNIAKPQVVAVKRAKRYAYFVYTRCSTFTGAKGSGFTTHRSQPVDSKEDVTMHMVMARHNTPGFMRAWWTTEALPV